MARPQLTPGKDLVPILQVAGWASGPVWTGAENLSTTGIRFPDRPARKQTLFGLLYPTHTFIQKETIILSPEHNEKLSNENRRFHKTCAEWRAACTPHSTLYTQHNLKHVLPQHRNTYNDVFLLINFKKFNFSKAQLELREDGPDGSKHVEANIKIF